MEPLIEVNDKKVVVKGDVSISKLLFELKRLRHKFILINYPNPDIVGHTGNIGPTVKSIETVDSCIGKIANFVLAYDGALIITADHGNAEEMVNPHTGEVDTEHSANPVPFIVVSKRLTGKSQVLTSGILADVAPTILFLLGIKIPDHYC